MELSLSLKIAALAILLFSSYVLCFAGRFSARALAAGLFTISIAGYLGCQISHVIEIPALLRQFIHAGCFSVPVAFLILTESLFEDNFHFRLRHLAYLLSIEIFNFFLVGYVQIYAPSAESRFGESLVLMRSLPQILSLGFLIFAVGKVLIRRTSDLIEERRRFRLKFTGIVGTYMLAILIMEIALHGAHGPGWLDTIHSAGVLATVWYLTGKILTVREGTIGELTPPRAKTTSPVDVDATLLAKLKHAMQVDRIFTEESLSIRRLAEHLTTQEYLLRRLINQALGYKNFNDYLNEIRIGEACRLLADKDQSALPIIRIAMDLGFGSLAPFNRAFKVRKGVTPTEFRRAG